MNKKKLSRSIILVVLMLVLVSLSFLLREIIIEKRIQYWEDWEEANIQEQTIEQSKIILLRNIPEKYEVVNSESIPLSFEDNGCDFIYEIYPKEYSEIERKYLEHASVMFFKDINKVSLPGQVEEITYNQESGKWVYISREEERELEVRHSEEYSISIGTLGGSHVMTDYYILSSDSSDYVIVMSIPTWSRVRCEFVDDQDERKACEDLLVSMGVDINNDDSVPEEVYEEYYDSLLEILEEV